MVEVLGSRDGVLSSRGRGDHGTMADFNGNCVEREECARGRDGDGTGALLRQDNGARK